MKTLLIGINAKYIHPAISIYQLKANTKEEVFLYETTIKEPIEAVINELIKHVESGVNHLAFSTYLWNIELIKEIIPCLRKKHPNLIISAGGPETGYDPSYYLTLKFEKHYYFDYILSGEGENSFDELCKYLDNKIILNQVSNLYYRKENNILFTYKDYPNLKDINLAVFDVPNYKNRVIYLESSRGCPFHCSYCTASLENNVRYFPHQDILNVLERLMAEKVKIVKFLDRTFNANPLYMKDILNLIKEKNQSTIFQFEVMVDLLSKDILDLITSMPKKFLRLEIGIQSMNETVNLSINRKQNKETLKANILSLLKTKKVDLHVDLIAGLPFENKSSFINSFNETFLLKPTELQLGFLKFLRGTTLLDYIKEHGYIYQKHAPYEIISNKYLSEEELKEIHQVEDALDKYYNSGKFSNTFDYLLKNNLISNPYQFFLNLYNASNNLQNLNRQLHHLFLDFDTFVKQSFLSYENIHFLIQQDYLKNNKVRPKIWWDKKLTKEDRKLYYPIIQKKYPELTLDILYQYTVVIVHNHSIFIALYQNNYPQYFLFNY